MSPAEAGLNRAAGLDFTRLLPDKVALVTGAASGQGRAAACLFGAHGARVVVADINDEGAAQTVRMLEEQGNEGLAVHSDVSVRADVDTMIDAAMERYGRLDVLYNNAAVQMSGRLVECTEADWDLTIATNLSAIFWACRAALPHLLEGEGGSIINTASTLGLIGSEGYAAYGAAKAGLVLLTQQIAVEYGPSVRANVIAPGLDRHPTVPQGARQDPRGGRVRRRVEEEHPGPAPRHRGGRRSDRAVPRERHVLVHHRRGPSRRRRTGGVPVRAGHR